MKKKYLSLFLCTALLISGCGKSTSDPIDVKVDLDDVKITVEPEQLNLPTFSPLKIEVPEEEEEEELNLHPYKYPQITPNPELIQMNGEDAIYSNEFLAVIEQLKQDYILIDYKGIDLDALSQKYYPIFQELDESKDETAVYDTWVAFTDEIPDGHFYVTIPSDDSDEVKQAMNEHKKRLLGYDYGFCLITKENGDTIFVNVDENGKAYESGIRSGYRILSIDGQDMKEAMMSVPTINKEGDNYNRKFYESLALTCNLGETITITYEDENGKVNEAKIQGEGNLFERYQMTSNTLLHSCKEKENFSYEMVSKDTAIWYINSMYVFSSNGYDQYGDYDELKNSLTMAINEMKANGATKLIIDLRGNGGGYGEVSTLIESLFMKEETFSYQDSAFGKECSIELSNHYAKAENLWGDGEILLLINNDTASAAETFEFTMKQLPNVRTIGFTNSCGATGGCMLYDIESAYLSYPFIVSLDKDNNLIAEADSSGDMTMPVDIRIPLDEEAYQKLFVEGEDYVLSYAMDVLDGKRK